MKYALADALTAQVGGQAVYLTRPATHFTLAAYLEASKGQPVTENSPARKYHAVILTEAKSR